MKLMNRPMELMKALIICAACAVMLALGLTLGATSQALADEPEQYPLYIQGVQVTSDNASDIMGDGTVSYDAATSTLTLDGFTVTGQPEDGPGADMPAIFCNNVDLTVNLKGDNVIVCGSKGDDSFVDGRRKTADAFWVNKNLTFTGDGNLYAGGGCIPTGHGSGSGFHAIFSHNKVSFDEGFSGVAVIQGPNVEANGSANDNSRAILCGDEFSIKGGTVILTGGTTVNGMSEGLNCTSASIEGGVLVAQGGIELGNSTAYGIYSIQSVSVNGGVLIARGGVRLDPDGSVIDDPMSYGQNRRKAIGILDGSLVIGEGMSVLGEVGYVNGTFTSDAEALDNGGVVTGLVIGSNSFVEIDELPAVLEGDVYHISTDGTSFTTDAESLDTAGHTALFVNLFESMSANTETSETLTGAEFTSDGVSFTGEGKVVSMGGLQYNTGRAPLFEPFGFSQGLAGGNILLNGGEAGEGPTVVGVGGHAGEESFGCFAKTLDVQSGNFVSVGGSAGSSASRGGSCGIISNGSLQGRCILSTRGTAKALVVGGAAGAASSGLWGGNVQSFDTSVVMAVGGTAAEGDSFGANESETAYGGTVACIGGFSRVNSYGCYGSIVSFRGGKAIALGGGEGSNSYGSLTENTPAYSYAGDMVVAGRTRAFNFAASGHEEDKFLSCSEGASGDAWMDYDGTQGWMQIYQGTTLGEVANCKRIVIHGMPMLSVEFEANGGTGEMETVLLKNGDTRIVLPENGFGAPEFKRFDTWLCKDGESDLGERLNPGDSFNVSERGIVVAQWADIKWMRVAGTTRYDTMAAISQKTSPDMNEWAIVASGENFPDALSASAVAGWKDCPLILTSSQELSDQARAELERLGVKNVYLMGGPLAVSDGVEDEIEGLNGGVRIERVAGETRCETAVEAMKLVAGESDTVIVATGKAFPDSLSIAPYSCKTKSPIVLTRNNGMLDASVVEAIKDCGFKRFIIVGGPIAVNESVAVALRKAGLTQSARLGGAERYETSYLIANFSLSNGLDAANPAVATGENFPDALAAGPLQAKRGSILVLVKDDPSSDAVSLLVDKAPVLNRGYVIGGPDAVSQELMDYIRDATEGTF